MFFSKYGHRTRFVEAVIDTKCFNQSTGKIDKKYGAAFYLLTAHEGIWSKCKKYVSSYIDFSPILKNGRLSTGERILVLLANEMYGGVSCDEFSINDMISFLDDGNYNLCLEAIRFKRSNDFRINVDIQNETNQGGSGGDALGG